MRPQLEILVVAALALTGCDLATVPATTSAGLARPAVYTRVIVDVEGLPPAVDALLFDVSSLAIRRTRDRQWLPLIVSSTTVALSPEEPTVQVAATALGADTYDRLEIVTGGVQLMRQGKEHNAELDRDDAMLAVQWVLDRSNVDLMLRLNYRADFDLTANSLDVVFAPLADLQ